MEFSEILPQLTPDVQVETNWTGSITTLPSSKKKLLLLGTSLATGTEPVPTGTNVSNVKRITSVAKAIEWWGKGSMLAIMAEYALKAAPKATIYGAPYPQGTTAATGTVTVTGTASGAGELVVQVGGDRVAVGIASGDTPTVIGAALEAAVNALPNGPTTAANATGTVTFSARNKGTSGNSVQLHATITPNITSAVAVVAMASGVTNGSPESQLAGVAGERFHVIALGDDDATGIGKLKVHAEAQSVPSAKMWCLGIAPSVDTAANVQTVANALDSYRMQIVWQEGAERPSFVVAAVFAARRALYDCKASLDDEPLPGLLAQYDPAKWPGAADIETALEEGIVVLQPHRDTGSMTVVRSVVTRQTAPIAFRDHTIAEKSDYTDETLIARFAYYKGKVLKTASPAGNPSTVTPDKATAVMNGALFDLDKEDVVQGVKDAIAAGLNKAEANATDPDRIDLACQFKPSRTAHFIAILKNYAV